MKDNKEKKVFEIMKEYSNMLGAKCICEDKLSEIDCILIEELIPYYGTCIEDSFNLYTHCRKYVF